MALTVPEATRAILETIDSELLPTSDIELSGQLLPVLRDENLSQDERKAAWAEATAFNFDSEGASPWGTFYGPVFTGTKADGSNHYAPDIAETDDSIFEYWEIRSAEARHPVLRARYADLVWDLKSRAISQRPNIRFAQIAIDSYIEAVGAKLFDGSIRAVQGCSRMLSLSLAVNDRGRVTLCKQAMLEFFNDSATPGHAGVWTVLFDSLTESKKVGLTIGETEGLIHTLEELLTACTQLGSAEFDPFSGHPAATRLASHYESIGEKDKAHRAIRAYGTAFEQRAVDAGPLQAMTWLQPVHDEYYKRGMSEDAERVRIALVEKGKNIGDDLTSMEVPIEITREQLRDFVAQITDGSVREALLRIAALFIPSANGVRAMLDAFVKDAPLFANFGLIHISNDHFVAHAGSIEDDPEGRLMAQLAQQIEIENLFLNESLSKLRNSKELTAEAIMCILDESPVFLKERRPLLMQGIQAYLDGDHTKAIHVIVPQIEQALRHLLTLLGGSGLKSARGGGTMQLKNLNEILRETSIVKCVPEDVRLYLLSFLADQRGQNLRNTVCHGLASPPYFTQRLSDQTLHALLSLAFFRACEIRAIP